MVVHHLILLTLHVVTFLLVAIVTVKALDEEVWLVTGVVGRTSDLPCYLNPRTHGDRPKLVLWYKKGISKPIISNFDGKTPEQYSTVQHDEGILTIGQTTATLTINSVSIHSGGLYECRVDFFKSPTHNSFVNLTVIVPPRSVEILESQTVPVRGNVVGPYDEGQKIVITCLSRDGFPLPNVTWWKNERIYDALWEVTGSGDVRNHLVVDSLSRSWHNQTLTCSASNTNLANPVTASVVVNMYLLPTTVVITNPGPIREGELVRLICTSDGSRPAATLKWIVEGIKEHTSKGQNYDGITTSTLLLNVTRKDDNSIVACQATNPTRPSYKLTNTTVLSVQYPPKVKAEMGKSLLPDSLDEGVDVYFTCVVDANPSATLITWYHEDKLQRHKPSLGVIVSGISLALQRVNRHQAGLYTCSATNKIATAKSLPVRLRIRYKPECVTFPTTYFIYDKPINITCTVTSYPPVSSIYWQWNNSNDVRTTKPITAELEKSSAQLTVNPIESREDRVLSCWAVNEMGDQIKPCGFTFKVAQMPLPLSSCRLANITASSLCLTCQKPQEDRAGTTIYRAEVYFENFTLFANVTSTSPSFNVSQLDAGTSYQIKVYVTHGPVTSQPVVVSAYTSRSSKTVTADSSTKSSGTSVGGALGGIAMLLMSIVGLCFSRNYCRKRWKRRKQGQRPPSDDANPDVVPNIEETYDLLSSGEGKSASTVYDTSLAEDPPIVMNELDESYQRLMIQNHPMDVEEYPEVSTELYCPVDQLMKAEESIV